MATPQDSKRDSLQGPPPPPHPQGANGKCHAQDPRGLCRERVCVYVCDGVHPGGHTGTPNPPSQPLRAQQGPHSGVDLLSPQSNCINIHTHANAHSPSVGVVLQGGALSHESKFTRIPSSSSPLLSACTVDMGWLGPRGGLSPGAVGPHQTAPRPLPAPPPALPWPRPPPGD